MTRRAKEPAEKGWRDPAPLPRSTPYASPIESDVPIEVIEKIVVVQYTRLDSRQPENALLSTMAFAGDE